MQNTERRSSTPRSARHALRFTGLAALAALIVACGSTETASTTMTGVWGGRTSYVTPSDSFAFFFTQNGAEVEGWGIFYSGAGPGADTRFVGGGVIAGGELTMTLTDVTQNSSIFAGGFGLSGTVGRSPMNAVFEAGGKPYPITLRAARPAAGDVAGTWVLTSTTGAAAPAGLLDTLIVSADGRANRHREGDYAFVEQAIWSRHGLYLILDQSGGGLMKDSLLIGSPELLRTAVTASGSRIEHFTRVSTSSALP